MSLAIRGNDFCKFFGANKPKVELVDRKLTQKSTVLGQVGTHDLAILGVEKVLHFFEVVLDLFRNCLGIVFDLKRLTIEGIFSSKG